MYVKNLIASKTAKKKQFFFFEKPDLCEKLVILYDNLLNFDWIMLYTKFEYKISRMFFFVQNRGQYPVFTRCSFTRYPCRNQKVAW